MGKRVQLNLYVPEDLRNKLQKIGAYRMLKDPKRKWSAVKVAAEIILNYLQKKKIDDECSINDEMQGGIENGLL